MPAAQTAYLVIHKLAVYNDEFYEDMTEEAEVANPAAIFTSFEEAETYVQAMTRNAMCGADLQELMLDEDGATALLDTDAENPLDDEQLYIPQEARDILNRCLEKDERLPTNLTDEVADELIAYLNVELFYVIETKLTPQQFSTAQITLEGIQERPPFWEYYDQEGNAYLDYGGNEAAERLDRVTQLFGRRYATDLGY